ncbi:MAG: hypothetical protein D6819_02195 [Gammaproteobacteria bacterium]|nr:MAG: hypothetical protein D6819_02195 [Gammaproteobacteria bacterium]
MKQHGESISCLVDGEIDHVRLTECIECLEHLPDERLRWQAYLLIDDALKRRLPSVVDPHFSQRVQAALQKEPPLASSPKGRFSKQTLGLMIAASLGAVALLGLYLAMDQKPSPSSAHQAESAALAQSSQVDYLIDHSAYGVSSGIQGMLSHVRIVGYHPE